MSEYFLHHKVAWVTRRTSPSPLDAAPILHRTHGWRRALCRGRGCVYVGRGACHLGNTDERETLSSIELEASITRTTESQAMLSFHYLIRRL